jgi:hypothetical protein
LRHAGILGISRNMIGGLTALFPHPGVSQ